MIAFLSLTLSQTEAHPLSITRFARLARQCAPNVAASTIAAIARTESGFDPLAIYDNSTGLIARPASTAAAVRIAARLIAAGHSVDLGLMQVNTRNLPAVGLTLQAVFDPCRSIAAGAAILADDYTGGVTHAARQAALRVALSRYNTGDPERGFANGYVRRVEVSARRVVPALDVGIRTKPAAGWARTEMAAAPTDAPAWEVFPPAPGHAESGNPSSKPDAAILADVGTGAATPVVDYPDDAK